MAQEEEEQKRSQNLNIVNTIQENKKHYNQEVCYLCIPNLQVISLNRHIVTRLVQLNQNLIDARLEQLLRVMQD